MKNNPLTGATYLLRGLGLITRRSVRPYVIMPVLLNVVLFSTLIWFGAGWFEGLMNRFVPPDWDAVRWLLWPIFALATLLIGFYTFAILANLIAAPFNGMLAEAVERELTGQAIEGTGGLKGIAKDVALSVQSELRKLGYVLPRMLVVLIVFFIPVINVTAPFLWFALSAWMLAISYADFPMANHGMGFRDQRERLGRRRFAAFGFGAAATVMVTIPFLNFIAIPAAVAGATAMWVDQLRDA